jgi:hypothetical protein
MIQYVPAGIGAVEEMSPVGLCHIAGYLDRSCS